MKSRKMTVVYLLLLAGIAVIGFLQYRDAWAAAGVECCDDDGSPDMSCVGKEDYFYRNDQWNPGREYSCTDCQELWDSHSYDCLKCKESTPGYWWCWDFTKKQKLRCSEYLNPEIPAAPFIYNEIDIIGSHPQFFWYPVAYARKYYVYIKIGSSNYYQIGTTSYPRWIDPRVVASPGTTLLFRVTAVNLRGESGPSQSVMFIVAQN
jgi:hypothetical protein